MIMSKEKRNHYGNRFVAMMLMVVALLATGCTEKEEVDKDWVDLGLPSGLLWATRNVGATAPEDYGDYFAWGETSPKSVYNWNTYIYGNHWEFTKYCNYSSCGYNGFTDTLTTLQPGDDAATANYGGRTPTADEWQELIDNTTSEWTTLNGVNGFRFTGSNGNRLFLPAAGYRWDSTLDHPGGWCIYWSSSLYTDGPDYAWRVGIDQINVPNLRDYFRGFYRSYGCPVRAVRSAL